MITPFIFPFLRMGASARKPLLAVFVKPTVNIHLQALGYMMKATSLFGIKMKKPFVATAIVPMSVVKRTMIDAIKEMKIMKQVKDGYVIVKLMTMLDGAVQR